jgi:phospholipase C
LSVGGVLDRIETIVLLVFENRSFDHVFGHLRMPEHGGRADVEGLQNPTENPAYVNFVGGEGFAPFPRADAPFLHDPPHGRSDVQRQLAMAPSGRFSMSGFVDVYAQMSQSRVQDPPPMGFLTPADVPMSGFLAREFAVCDHWFCPIPTDTFPNRCVVYTGESLIDDSQSRVIPTNPGTLLFDWLDARRVPWRVYHSGLSFFALLGRPSLVLGDNFRGFRDLLRDQVKPPAAGDPRVIVVEPEYCDVPVHFGRAPNDNHPPLPIAPGEHFLREVFAALTANPQRWQSTLLVVIHDEHGGFFDHVPPPRLPAAPPPGALFTAPFETAGPRVPALVVSPYVARGRAFNGLMDHTSILQLIATKFAGTPDYSPSVARRRAAGIVSVEAVLDAGPGVPRADVPALPADTPTQAMLVPPSSAPDTPAQRAYADAGRRLLEADRAAALDKFPELAGLL